MSLDGFYEAAVSFNIWVRVSCCPVLLPNAKFSSGVLQPLRVAGSSLNLLCTKNVGCPSSLEDFI